MICELGYKYLFGISMVEHHWIQGSVGASSIITRCELRVGPEIYVRSAGFWIIWKETDLSRWYTSNIIVCYRDFALIVLPHPPPTPSIPTFFSITSISSNHRSRVGTPSFISPSLYSLYRSFCLRTFFIISLSLIPTCFLYIYKNGFIF